MKTGPTNQHLQLLIEELNKKGHESESNILLRLASDLSKSTRQRRVVNLSRINRFTKDGEIIVVPGKVLGTGELDHKVSIAAWTFSEQAKDKITKAQGTVLTINDLINSDMKGKKVRIIG